VEQLRHANVSPSSIYYDVFAPSMVTIGDLWERNELSVADEHLATAITERLIGQLSSSFNQPANQPERGNVVLGCVAGERHVLGLRMLADLFRQQGWRVLYLGADVPNADFVRLALRVDADVIAVSAGAHRHLPSVRALICELRAALPDVGIIVGGAVFLNDPETWREVGATLYHPDPQIAIQLVTTQHGYVASKQTI
jgi:methylmalonyl-CoA mutase cobalamin-binding domain/chain